MTDLVASTLERHGAPANFDTVLESFTANILKGLARRFGDPAYTRLNKTTGLQAVRRHFQRPEAVRRLAEGLDRIERGGLGLLKRRGGVAPAMELAVELLMLGHPLPERATRSYGYYGGPSHYAALDLLTGAGLAMDLAYSRGGYLYSSLTDARAFNQVFSDPRLLAEVEIPEPVPLPLSPAPGPEQGAWKRPQEVALRLVTVAEALRSLGEMKLTTKLRPGKPLLTKLGKLTGFDSSVGADPHAPLEEPALFFFRMLDALGLIGPPDQQNVSLHPSVDQLFEQSYELQALTWFRGYRGLTGWQESESPEVYESTEILFYPGKLNALRAGLLVSFAALPDPEVWYGVADLCGVLFERLGDYYTLSSGYYYSSYERDPKQARQRRRTTWDCGIAPWIRGAIFGPLYHLGFLEIARAGEGPAGELFRLTPLGRVLVRRSFHRLPPGDPDLRSIQPADDVRCWLVQPNFDVIVYLDRAQPSRLAGLSRIAERQPSEGGAALYRITRESVYAALESGLSAEQVIEALDTGAERGVPDTVQRAIRDWSGKHDRLAIHRDALLLEYATTEQRDADLHRLTGTGVGDRFLLVSRQTSGRPRIVLSRIVDYSEPPPACLDVADDGTVTLRRDRADLLVPSELGVWADPMEPGTTWRITAGSVQRAVGGGWTPERILQQLRARSVKPPPKLLCLAIAQWARKRHGAPSLGLATAPVLQAATDAVAEAIAESTRLKPYLAARLGPRTFLLTPERVDELTELLASLGLEPGDDLSVSAKAGAV
jgi:hypothetical protein